MMHNYSAEKTTTSTYKKTSKVTLSASVVGARGYAGVELCKLLLRHPNVNLTHAFATTEFTLENEILDPKAAQVSCLSEAQLMRNLTDIVFLATPAEVSLKLVPQLVAKGKRVIDLSGCFRLKINDTLKWYGFEQTALEELANSEYGLVPFCGPLQKSTKVIANPGCYATAISMALLPLLKRGLVDPTNLVIDAKSGTTGAGRKAAEGTLFSEVDGECLPYKVGKHQHLPEIQETIAKFSGIQIEPHFTTHLLPVKNGIVASIYAKSKTTDIGEIKAAYNEEFANYPLVRHGTEINKLARLKNVVGTPFTHISYELVGDKLYVFSLIDNLLKGAASQAVENLNRVLDLPSSFSLLGEN
jgi:N-acetyl-gamma-glutamyl-phosphate reductase